MARPAPSFAAETLREHVQALCAVGNRFVGTAGEDEARRLIVDRLGAAGAAGVHLERFDVLGYEPLASSCHLVGANLPMPAVGVQFTANAEIEAEAVYAGIARSVADIQAVEARGIALAGKVVVVDTYWPYLLAPYLVEREAAAIVVVSPNEEGLVPHFTGQLYPLAEDRPVDRRPLPIPGVTIERRAASTLLALMSESPRVVRVTHRARHRPVTTANVVGEVHGRDLPEERVVVGAHYDTQLEGVGACDNATGVAALIEAARACAASPPRRTVVFVAFADEEHGFLGSVDYCRRHEATLDQTVGMVCLDALAWAFPGGQSLHADPSMGDYAAARAREVGWDPAIVDASLLLGSDHNSFIDAGVPACWFWRYPPQHPGYHSTGDRLDIIDFDLVAETARVAAHTAFSLADEAGAAPLGRSRPTRRWLDLRPSGGMKGDRQNDVQPCLDTGPGDARTATVAVRDPGIQ